VWLKRLHDSGMLAVDGDELGTRGLHRLHKNVARRDKALFVGKGDAAPLGYRLQRGLEARNTDDRCNCAISFKVRRFFEARSARSGGDAAARQLGF
jgi:hypothetical protein